MRFFALEPGAMNRIVSTEEWSLMGGPTMSSSGSEFEKFARDCVNLARQAPSPELREKLFDMAREWMRAAMDGQDAPRRTMPGSRRNKSQAKTSSPHPPIIVRPD
jgi:hypothetical protein